MYSDWKHETEFTIAVYISRKKIRQRKQFHEQKKLRSTRFQFRFQDWLLRW